MQSLRQTTLVALLALATTGCRNLYRYSAVESVAVDADGRMWLAGSEGLAANATASKVLRRDYPINDYENFQPNQGTRTASVLLAGKEVYLMTRYGTRYRWDGASWAPAPTDLERGAVFDPDRPFARDTVDSAFTLPDQRIFLKLHSGELLWMDADTGHIAQREKLLGEVSPVLAIGDTLVGSGFANDGRAIVRRSGPDQWETLAVLPAADLGRMIAAGTVQGALVFVFREGLVVLAPDGQARFVDIHDLSSNDGKPLHSRGVPVREAKSNSLGSIGSAVFLPDESLVIVLSNTEQFVVRGAGVEILPPCKAFEKHRDAYDAGNLNPRGVVPFEQSLVAVLADGSLVALEKSGCRSLPYEPFAQGKLYEPQAPLDPR